MANWRGFTIGQRDIFEGIIEVGSTIVENLCTYKKPMFVYIPKTRELQGGACVVVDSNINSDEVEMYVETIAKGGVPEPEGMIQIKLCIKYLLECMHRIDSKLISLMIKLHEAKDDHLKDEVIQQQIKVFEKKKIPFIIIFPSDSWSCMTCPSPNVLNITLVDFNGMTKVPVSDQSCDIEA